MYNFTRFDNIFAMKGYSKYFWFIHFIGDVFFINIALW